MTISVGLVGFGLSGSVFHAPFLTRVPGLSLGAVVTSDPAKVHGVYPQVQTVASVDELLARTSVDLVVITTPNTTHHAYARQALLAGKHVVVEKPFTVTTAEADDLIGLAAQRNLVLSVYQNRRWDGDFLTVRRLLEGGALGDLVRYESHFDRFRPDVRVRWREQDLPGSGLLYDLGSHLIDQALVLFGLPRSVRAELKMERAGAQTVDAFDLTLDYGRLTVALRAGSLIREPRPRFALFGAAGSFVKYGLDPQEDSLRAGGGPGAPGWGADRPELYGRLTTDLHGLTFTGSIATLPGQYQAYYEGIASAIREGQAPPVTAQQARDTMRIIELAVQSAGELRTVTL